MEKLRVESHVTICPEVSEVGFEPTPTFVGIYLKGLLEGELMVSSR